MSRLHHVSLTCLAALFWLLAVGVVWGQFIDTTPPIEILSGTVISYDRNTRVVLIEWEALKHRHCPGTRVGWLRDGVVVPLPEIVLPPEDFRNSPAPDESVIHWRTAIDVPPYLTDDFVYKAEWNFVCNPVQTIFPLRVASPLVSVSQH